METNRPNGANPVLERQLYDHRRQVQGHIMFKYTYKICSFPRSSVVLTTVTIEAWKNAANGAMQK